MRILMLTAHPGITGPLPKLAPLMIDEMRRLGCDVQTEPWSHRQENESPLAKAIGRTLDLWRVRRRLKNEHFDVMLVTTTHDWPALLRDIPLLAATRRTCRARVLHFHGSMVDRLSAPGHRLMRMSSRWAVRRADAVLVLSHEELRQWKAFAPEARFEVVTNPFLPPAFAHRQRIHTQTGQFVVLFVGRLIPEKGVFDLLEALRIMGRDRTVHLRLAGRGSYEAQIRTRVAELELQACVELVGYVEGEALAELYLSSDVLALPTYFGEGFPTVITEAMSYGLPIVTTPIRGAADQLEEGKNVVFVPPRDPASLADALLLLLNNPGVRADIGERNRERVKAFAPSAVVPRYVEIMRSLM